MIQVKLTPTERIAYEGIMEHDCFSAREIQAYVGFNTRATAAKNMTNIIRKLGYKNMTELVIKEKEKLHASRG